MRRASVINFIMRTVIVLALAIMAHSLFLMPSRQITAQEDAAQGAYASVNGLKLYYEIHGIGEPLIMIHGGLGTVGDFVQLLPLLAKTRKVIAVELQGHGHTADIDRPFSYEDMSDDVAALIKQLGLDKTDILGHSLGGGVALQTAIRHPDVVRKLVLISTVYMRNGWYPDALAGMAAMNADAAKAMLQTPIYQVYAKVAPKPEDWPKLVTKLGQLLAKDYDWSKEVAAIKAPTLIVIGDSDRVRPVHAVDLVGLLGGGKMDGGGSGFPGAQMEMLPQAQLAVLPGTTHFTILSRTDLLLPVIPPFLDAPMPQAK